MTPADTIREALTQASVTLDLYGKAVLSRECYDALAALTELEQQVAVARSLDTGRLAVRVDRAESRAEAAEAERDLAISAAQEQRRLRRAAADRDRLQAELDRHKDMEAVAGAREFDVTQERDRYRDALEQLKAAVRAWDADLSDACDGPLRDAARAALATPDTQLPDPSSHGGHPYTATERQLGYGTDHDPRFATPDTPDTPPDA